jgi:ABC-type multidrug transport system fused ATPase/permease subunit
MYRKNISVLFQDFLKFEGSLLENVHLGNVEKEIDKNEIKNALESADVNFLRDEDDYLYENFLGNWFEDGSQLSGGEWQKIALARTYYKSASLYMLDEPSSALDVLSEMKIFNHFFKNRKNTIGIFITHRSKIAKCADKIIVLNQGKVVATGSHEYLSENCSFYNVLLSKEMELDLQ